MNELDAQTFNEGTDYIIGVLEKAVIEPLRGAKAAMADGDPGTANLRFHMAISNLRDLLKNIDRKLGLS